METIMNEINLEKFLEICNNDFEFNHNIRYWTGSYKIGFGDKVYLILFADGKISGFKKEIEKDFLSTCWTLASIETWEEMLKPIPKPGYNSFRPAMFYHGLELSQGYSVTQYPMLNRFLVLLREYYNAELPEENNG